MESMADKLHREINNVSSIEQAMTLAKQFEVDFIKSIENFKNVKKVPPKSPKMDEENAKKALNDYLNSFRDSAANVDSQNINNSVNYITNENAYMNIDSNSNTLDNKNGITNNNKDKDDNGMSL